MAVFTEHVLSFIHTTSSLDNTAYQISNFQNTKLKCLINHTRYTGRNVGEKKERKDKKKEVDSAGPV